MEHFAKIVNGFYFRKRLHLRWKSLAIFARCSIFDNWYSPEYASGIGKCTRWKIGKFSRTSLSIILQSACRYLKSIRFHKDYPKDFYRSWPTDQNSSNILHLCINSITIYPKSRTEATIQRCSLKGCSQTQRCSVEQLLSFFPTKFTRNYLFQNLFWLILQAVGQYFIKESPVKVVYFELYNISQNYFFVECL